MTVHFKCPNCGASLGSRTPGKVSRCPSCHQTAQAPPECAHAIIAEEMIVATPIDSDPAERKARREQGGELASISLGRRRESHSSNWGAFGAMLIIGGLLGLFYFFEMDTTVAVNSFGFSGFPQRVHNIGLLSERQNGLIVSSLASFAGLIIVLWERKKPRD